MGELIAVLSGKGGTGKTSVCAGVAAALAGVNAVTAPIIEKLNAEKTTKAIAAVLPDAQTAVVTYEAASPEDAVQTVYTSESGYAVKVQTAACVRNPLRSISVNSAAISIPLPPCTAGL